MTTKRLVMVIAAVLVVLALLVGVSVGGIILFTFYSFGTSDAAVTAKEFLRNNEQLQRDIGEVREILALSLPAISALTMARRR